MSNQDEMVDVRLGKFGHTTNRIHHLPGSAIKVRRATYEGLKDRMTLLGPSGAPSAPEADEEPDRPTSILETEGDGEHMLAGMNFVTMTKAELVSLCEALDITVQGSGTRGSLLKMDLVAALEAEAAS